MRAGGWERVTSKRHRQQHWTQGAEECELVAKFAQQAKGPSMDPTNSRTKDNF